MPENNYIFQLSDVKEKIDHLREHGIARGKHCGFEKLYEHYSIMPGCMTWIMGPPDTGKTFFLFELLLNLSQFHNWNHIIYSPEMGNSEDIFGYLVEMAAGAKLQNIYPEQYQGACDFINDHFVILDPQDRPFKIHELFEQADVAEFTSKMPKKFHTITGDPFNEFDHDFRDDSGRQDLYIERVLGECRRTAKVQNRHLFLVTHSRDMKRIELHGDSFFPIATPHDYAGGQAWYRKGLGMIAFWRPPFGVDSFDYMDHNFKSNEVLIRIQKAKPRGVGKKGDVYLFFDLEKQRYYDIHPISGSKMFAKEI